MANRPVLLKVIYHPSNRRSFVKKIKDPNKVPFYKMLKNKKGDDFTLTTP